MSNSNALSTKRARLIGAASAIVAVAAIGAMAVRFAGAREAVAAGSAEGERDSASTFGDDRHGSGKGGPARRGGSNPASRDGASRSGAWRSGANGADEPFAQRSGALTDAELEAQRRSGEIVNAGALQGDVPLTHARLHRPGGAGLAPGARLAPGAANGSSHGSPSGASPGAPGAEPFCGDNIVQGTECEPPGTPLCSDDCIPVTDLGCFDCEQAGDCWEFSESCTASNFDPGQQSLCFDVQECVKETDCADSSVPLTACFCGDLSTAACIAAPLEGPTSPPGACADVIRQAMGGPGVTNGQVLARYINIAYAGGAALARMNCQKLAPACTSACGF